MIWEQTVLAWIMNNHDHPVLIVRYEDVKNNTHSELRRMLDFLQVPYSSSRLKEVVARGYRMYRRDHGETFDHYTPGQRDTVTSAIEHVSKRLKDNGLLELANVMLLYL
jgi:DNA-binding NtrC family response regulator